MLMCYKKQGQSEQFVRIFIIFATTIKSAALIVTRRMLLRVL